MKRFLALFALSLFLFSKVIASIHPNPGKAGFQAEFLYFHPSEEQSFFVIKNPANDRGAFPVGNRIDNDPTFRPAWRVEGVLALCSCVDEWSVRFTSFNTGLRQHVRGNTLFIVQQDPSISFLETSYNGTAQSDLDFKYYSGDLTFGRMIYDCEKSTLAFLVGLHSAYLTRKEDVLYTGTGPLIFTLNSKNHSRFWGIGPQFGCDFEYIFCCPCLKGTSFVANARGALLVSEIQNKTQFIGAGAFAAGGNDKVKNHSTWHVTPAFDVRAGLSHDWLCSCFIVKIELGYECIWYHHAVDVIKFPSTSKGATFDLYSNFSLHGPYVALGLGF